MAYRWQDDVPTDGFGFRQGEDAMGFTAEERELTIKAHTRDEFEVLIRARDERRLKEHEERERQAWPTTRAGQLLKKLGECFAEYKECLEQDPRLQEKALAFDEMNQKIFNRIKTNIERAHKAPRCRHEKAGGGTCRAPECAGRSIAICTRCWKMRVRRRSVCRTWAMRTRSMERLPKERRQWWTESWNTNRRQYLDITCNWH